MIRLNPEAKGRKSNRPSRYSRQPVTEKAGLESFLAQVLDRFQSQVREKLPAYRDAILASGKSFLSESRRDLERWAALLAAGSISQEEFEWLVQARVHLAEMKNLELAGLTLARIDELRMTLVRSITGTAFHLIGL